MAIGAEGFAVKLYKAGNLTLNEATELSDASVREMVDIILDQQKSALNFALESS